MQNLSLPGVVPEGPPLPFPMPEDPWHGGCVPEGWYLCNHLIFHQISLRKDSICCPVKGSNPALFSPGKLLLAIFQRSTIRNSKEMLFQEEVKQAQNTLDLGESDTVTMQFCRILKAHTRGAALY